MRGSGVCILIRVLVQKMVCNIRRNCEERRKVSKFIYQFIRENKKNSFNYCLHLHLTHSESEFHSWKISDKSISNNLGISLAGAEGAWNFMLKILCLNP